MINFLDTSAVLHGNCLKEYQNIYISPLTIMELEGIKNSNKPDSIKYRAREAVREIINRGFLPNTLVKQSAIDKLLKKNNFLSNINDHKIICEAVILTKKEEVTFITYDGAQYLFATHFPELKTVYLSENQKQKEDLEYCGWGKYFPTETQFSLIYSDPKINILGCKTNEFAELYEGDNLKDILFWNGHEYCPLKYHDIKNSYINEIIKPKNLEQKMAIHLLQNQDIKVKLLTSSWGSGKTLLALSYALEQVGRGTYQKLVFIRNNIIAADTNDIGFLPGGLREKLSIWSAVIADHLGGQEELDSLMDSGVIEVMPLSHIRGRSIRNSIVMCDECENLTDKHITLLLSRIEESSEIIFCGDIAQIDSKRFEEHNGVRALVKCLAGEPLFGMVKLIKSERGPVSKLCDLIIPPR